MGGFNGNSPPHRHCPVWRAQWLPGLHLGEFFLIDSPNPTIKEFIKISTHAKAIRAALHELTGHNYKLGLFKKKSTEQAPRRDPLEDLLSKARENHIQIEEH